MRRDFLIMLACLPALAVAQDAAPLLAVMEVEVVTWASYQVTTTGASQTHTLGYLTVTATTTVDWGDDSSNDYTGASARTHVYATAGTYTVKILQPANVTRLQLNENTITVNSADVKLLVNVLDFRAYSCKAGRWDSADVSAWRPTNFLLHSMPSGYAGTFDSADVSAWRPSAFYLLAMPSGYAGTFDSADVSAWRPTTFILYSMPSGYAGTFDSADVSAWRPTEFYLLTMPSGYAGTFDSADVSAWRPTAFYLHSMPSGYAGTFDSADVSAWRPTTFYLFTMPSGYAGTFDSADVSAWRPTDFYLYSMPSGYAGTFDSADVSAWRPTHFQLRSMPSGYAGTFDSADVSAWRPTLFQLLSMPTATYAFTITANSFKNWTTGLNNFQMHGNALSEAQVNLILWELYQAAITPRTATVGTINLGGSNAAPSGTYQACASCPVAVTTPGREVAHELKNDGCAVGFNKWTTVTVN